MSNRTTLLIGVVLLVVDAGTSSISTILAEAPTGAVVDAALVLILVGALSKSAIFPFHFWLPGAMAAPTPVSAYLHAAAMVKAGIYLIARLARAGRRRVDPSEQEGKAHVLRDGLPGKESVALEDEDIHERRRRFSQKPRSGQQVDRQ